MKILTKELITDFFLSTDFTIKTPICEVLIKYGSDKCSDWHNYLPFYNFLFSDNKLSELNIFEVGILFGSSIRAWEEYFENSKIFCGDFNTEYLINKGNVKSYYCNQDDSQSILSMWENDELKNEFFDIIIDDGKHEFSSNCNFLLHSYYKLKDKGYFIIEDLTNNTYNNFVGFIENFKKEFKPSFIELIKINNDKNNVDNNLLVIQK